MSKDTTLARLLADKQESLEAAQNRYDQASRAVIRILGFQGTVSFGEFPTDSFLAAVEDVQKAVAAGRPLEQEVRELRGSLA